MRVVGKTRRSRQDMHAVVEAALNALT
jgi:hypothetical protein